LEAEAEEEVGVAINNSRADLNNLMEEVDAAAVKCQDMLHKDIINSNHNQCTMLILEWVNKVIHMKDNKITLTCREVVEVEGRILTQPTKTTKDLLLVMFLISPVDSRKKTRLLSRLGDYHIKSDMKRLLTFSEILDISKKVQYSVLEVMDGKMVLDQFCLKIRKNRERQPRNLMAHTLAKDMLSLASFPMVITSSLMAHLEVDSTMVRLSNFPNMLDLTTKRDPLL